MSKVIADREAALAWTASLARKGLPVWPVLRETLDPRAILDRKVILEYQPPHPPR